MNKKIVFFNLILIFVFATCSLTYALSGIGINPKPGISTGEAVATNVIGAMQWIGYAIALGMLIFIGIKYIIASADDKATIKNAAFKYIFGAFLIAGAVGIAGLIFK